MNNESADGKEAKMLQIEAPLKGADAKIANLVSLAENGVGFDTIGERIR